MDVTSVAYGRGRSGVQPRVKSLRSSYTGLCPLIRVTKRREISEIRLKERPIRDRALSSSLVLRYLSVPWAILVTFICNTRHFHKKYWSLPNTLLVTSIGNARHFHTTEVGPVAWGRSCRAKKRQDIFDQTRPFHDKTRPLCGIRLRQY